MVWTAAQPVDPFNELQRAPRDQPVALIQPCGSGPARLLDRPIAVLEVPGSQASEGMAALQQFLQAHRDLTCAGYLGYDLRDAIEPLPRRIGEDLPLPALFVAAFERERTFAPRLAPPPPSIEAASRMRPHATRADYEARVGAVVEHIRAGDIFQANLTQPFTGRFEGDPRQLFWRLCALSPAPFATYLETADGLAVLSSSPEEFLTLAGREVRTRPIKGTRRRDPDPELDRALLDELLHSAKDRAELAMIVDLMRNDIGKVAVPGTVRVGAFPEHASFPHVHHLLATVTATLREEVELVDLLRATFPPGSCTGAPKLRCMEILEQLEWTRRGVYTGAIGVFGPGPQLRLNVAIRTITCKHGVVRFHTGGGVTADSVPAAEFDETLDKARGMLAALQTEIEAR